MTRIALHTFGCKANQYDTEVVRQALQAAGVAVVDDWHDADAVIVNSCTVTHVSEAKMRGLVRRVARANQSVRTVVMGCAAAVDDGSIAALPNVSDVVRGTDPTRVLEALDLPVGSAARVLQSFAVGRRAWLKIQDGCDEHCTFCATVVARGASRSRAPDVIVEEALALGSRHAEIVLTGVHVGSYGRDRDDGMRLGDLVALLIRRVPAVRFRLSSLEATEVDDSLVECMESSPDRLAPHLHAPLQSGSDRILRRMGRHWYTAGTYRSRLEQIAARIPRLGLGADVLVGFPGETDADYVYTKDLVEALPFTYLHVFPYSERPGASARKLGPPVEPPVVAVRSAELRAIARAKAQAYRRGRAGSRADVVLLERSHGRFEGLTEDYLTITGATCRSLPPRFTALVEAEGADLALCPAVDCP